MTFAQLVAAASSRAHGSVEGERGLVVSGTYTLPGAPFSFGAHAVVVEVNRETGQVTILRYVGVHDCGRIVNPRLVEGQIIGGIAQGLGQALTEDVVYSPEGQPLTGSLLDYALPKAPEVPFSSWRRWRCHRRRTRSGRRGSGRCPRSRRRQRWLMRCWTRWPASGCAISIRRSRQRRYGVLCTVGKVR